MNNNPVRIIHFTQRVPWVAMLSSLLAPFSFLTRLLLGSVRIVFIRRGRLTAVTAVFLEFGQFGFEFIDPIPEHQHQINNRLGIFSGQLEQLFSTRALWIAGNLHLGLI